MSTNGRMDVARELVAVSGTHLAPATATAFTRMAAACYAATGERLDIVNGSGGYRDWDAQATLYRNPPRGVKVAPPGKSTHGFGRALDLATTCYTDAVANWCRRNCSSYGFAVPPSHDPRHFQHNGTTLGPATTTQQELHAMTANIDFAFTPEGIGYAITQDGGAEPMTSGQWAAFQHLRRVQDTPDGADRLTLGELVTISEFLRGVSAATGARTIRPLLSALAVDVDEESVANAIARLLPGQLAIPTAAAIADAVEAELADDFAAVPPKVIVEQKKPGN